MGYKVILIENDVKMSIKLNNIIINKEGHDIWISVDDVSLLVIDNMKITLTSRMLSYLAEHNVGMIFCDAKHLPIGYYCDYDNHSHISKILNYQIQYSQTEYDKLWKKIIIAKLNNQAGVLEILGKDNAIALKIKEYCDEITDGDKSNREAHGAKVYFNELMGTSFSRGNEDILLNSGLDYGYTIIRSYIARLCVGYGLNCQIGIHHKNEYNRFNLVDDLMEPLRPIVDLYTYRILKGQEFFKADHRYKIINIVNHFIRYKGKKMYLGNMLEEYVMMFSKNLKDGTELIFPDINAYEEYADEV